MKNMGQVWISKFRYKRGIYTNNTTILFIAWNVMFTTGCLYVLDHHHERIHRIERQMKIFLTEDL